MDAVSRIKIYYFYNNVNMAAFLIRLFSKGIQFGKLELRIPQLKKKYRTQYDVFSFDRCKGI